MGERQRHRQREKQAPCREPDAGLNPRTPGSRPEPKADAQPLSHPGAPVQPRFIEHLPWARTTPPPGGAQSDDGEMHLFNKYTHI